jgi:excisionase family DNA binding protein
LSVVASLRDDLFDLDEAERCALAARDPGHLQLVASDGVALPDGADRAVRRLLEALASGSSVQLIPVEAELTTQQAALLLGLSRTYVVRLIDQGTIPAVMVGTHRRLRTSDVLVYREQRERRHEALDRLVRADEELGIGY